LKDFRNTLLYNKIEFDATDFSQELIARPCVTARLSLGYAERLKMIRGGGEGEKTVALAILGHTVSSASDWDYGYC